MQLTYLLFTTHLRHTLQGGPGPGHGPRPSFRKSRTWTFRKSELYVKNNGIGQKFIFDKFQGVGFKYNNRFPKLKPKNTQIRLFWSQI